MRKAIDVIQQLVQTLLRRADTPIYTQSIALLLTSAKQASGFILSEYLNAACSHKDANTVLVSLEYQLPLVFFVTLSTLGNTLPLVL